MTERQTGKEHKRTHTQTIKQKQPKSYTYNYSKLSLTNAIADDFVNS